MDKEEQYFLSEENISEVVSRFKRSLISGRMSYFDVSEFEGIVESLLDEGDINTSEIAAKQGIQIHPGAVPLQLKYAQVLLSKGKYKNALEYLEIAGRIESSNPDVHLMKGAAWLIMGEDKKAERSFRLARKTDDAEKDDILYHIGAAYIQVGEVEKGLSYFEEALKINPRNEMALYELGFFSDQKGDYQKSIDFYNRYLDINPFNYSTWFNLGISYNKAGRFEEAIEAYEFCRVLNEDFSQPLFNIGNAFANAGKFREAVEKYREYLEIDPDNDDACTYIGECYLNLEDYVRAEYFYHKALQINQENDNAWFGAALIMWLERKWKESILFLKKALEIDDANPEYWLTLAKVYQESNRNRNAVDALRKAAKLDPDNNEIWLTWVDILWKSEKKTEAFKVLRKAMKKSDESVLKYKMAALFLETGNDTEGFIMLEMAIEQDPDHVDFLFEVYPEGRRNKKIRRLLEDYQNRK